jgi:hypothetical protein
MEQENSLYKFWLQLLAEDTFYNMSFYVNPLKMKRICFI